VQALEPGDPRVTGPYRLLARIATGGTATVYLGRSAGGRVVAVKVAHGHLAANPQVRAQFAHEVAVTRAAAGEYSPALLDDGAGAAVPWLALEFLPAVSLREAVRLTGPLPPEAVASLTIGVAEALRAVHAAGILHLDVNPANVLLTADGPRLIDFGLAGTDGAAPGSVAGAPGYIAPELLTGALATPASDVYALGATLVFAATGSRSGGVTSVTDETLRDVLGRCLGRDPALRPGLDELLRLPAAGPLPAALSAAIRDRASEAADPPPPGAAVPLHPLPAPRRGLRAFRPGGSGRGPGAGRSPVRSRVLLVAVAAGLLLAGVAGMRALDSPDSLPVPEADAASSPASLPAPSGSAATGRPYRTLRFSCGGNATVTRVVYTVNGRTTTVRDVRSPWERDVRVPPLPKRTTWEFRSTAPVGTLDCEVTIDGKHAYTYVSSGTPGPGGRPGDELREGVRSTN
jgi:hypothetical protein